MEIKTSIDCFCLSLEITLFTTVIIEHVHINLDKRRKNSQVYKVIYSTWEFSGYTGSFPEYNLSCHPYHLIVNKANNEFKEYNS